MQFWKLEPEWDNDNIEHIARHDVEPEEVEEIIMKIAIHHGLFALGVAAYEKPAGQSSARRVEVVTWLR